MKKIKRFILLAVLAAMAAVASAAPPKQPIDVAFAQQAQTLIDMGAITNSEARSMKAVITSSTTLSSTRSKESWSMTSRPRLCGPMWLWLT